MEKIEIKKVGINGEGIGYFKKKVCFVRNAYPGELVSVDLKPSKKYYTGSLIKVLKASPNRCQSKCKDELNCLGCSFASMDYHKQLEYKKEIINDTFIKYSSLENYQINDFLYGNKNTQYKNEVSLPVTYLNGKVVFGIYQRESKYLTVMDHCFLQNNDLNHLLKQIENILNKHNVRDYNDKVKKGLRFIKVRKCDNEYSVLFVTGTNGIDKEVTNDLKQIPEIKSVFYTINTSHYQDFDTKGYKLIGGNSKLSFNYKDFKYVISQKSDYPINLDSTIVKNNYIKSLINKDDSVLSVNCGIGLLELDLDQNVIGLDSRKENIEDAKSNANFLKKDHVFFKCKDIDDGITLESKKQHFNTLIVNDSLSDAILETIQKNKMEHIILVNNSLSNIVKDIDKLINAYDLELIQPIDSYPYTSKMDIIVKLNKK